METIRICKDKNVLKEYLQECEKEVVSIMLAMYDEKKILLSYIESEKYEATKKAAKETAVQMLRMGKMSVEEIAQCVPALSVEEIIQLQDELLQTV
jgi:uracil phosphoribosyltransferase